MASLGVVKIVHKTEIPLRGNPAIFFRAWLRLNFHVVEVRMRIPTIAAKVRLANRLEAALNEYQ
jgi:hypothetical protein